MKANKLRAFISESFEERAHPSFAQFKIQSPPSPRLEIPVTARESNWQRGDEEIEHVRTYSLFVSEYLRGDDYGIFKTVSGDLARMIQEHCFARWSFYDLKSSLRLAEEDVLVHGKLKPEFFVEVVLRTSKAPDRLQVQYKVRVVKEDFNSLDFKIFKMKAVLIQ